MDTGAPGCGASPHLLLLLALASLVVLLAPRGAAQPWPACGSTGKYTANSTYQTNIASLAKALPANASRAGTLFATGSAGAVPDTVRALALCRGDTNATACGSCVATAFQDAQQLCPYDKDAAVYYDACYLRFSNQNFLASTTNNEDPMILMNSQNVSSSVKAFDAAVAVLLNATGDYAAANSTRLFATGEEAFNPTDPIIYGLTQCTPDMSPADCRSCLGGIISMMPQYLSGSRGGRVIRMRCNFRYEVYSFFSGGPSLRLPAPSTPAPAPPPAPVNVTPTAATPDPRTGMCLKNTKRNHVHGQTTHILSNYL